MHAEHRMNSGYDKYSQVIPLLTSKAIQTHVIFCEAGMLLFITRKNTVVSTGFGKNTKKNYRQLCVLEYSVYNYRP